MRSITLTIAIAAAALAAVVGMLPPSSAQADQSRGARVRPLTAARHDAARPAVRVRPRTRARASVVGGFDVLPGAWPWMALVQSTGSTAPQQRHCGAALIAPRIVISAAHCFSKDPRPATYRIVLGRHDLTTSDGEVHGVASISLHPGWNSSTKDNDVALIELSEPSGMAPAALVEPAMPLVEGDRAVFMGWGLVSEDPALFPDSLKGGEVPLWSTQRCAEHMHHRGETFDVESMVCGAYLDGGVDACRGDSGGPLMVLDSAGTWRLLGVISWGHEDEASGMQCGAPGHPGVSAWVGSARMLTWIGETVAHLSRPKPAQTTATQPPQATTTASPAPVSSAADTIAPVIRRLRLSSSRFRARAGALIRVDVAEAVTLRIKMRRAGRLLPKVLEGAADPGANAFRLRDGTAGIRLRPGRHTLIVQAVDAAGNASPARSLRFTVMR